jgi:hypothetical protein
MEKVAAMESILSLGFVGRESRGTVMVKEGTETKKAPDREPSAK